MILDTSAILAIIFQEPGYEVLIEKLAGARNPGIGVPTLCETAIVISARLNRDARALVARFLMEGTIATVPFGDAHFAAAVDAWLRYGKGRHTASLNFGDCMSYATARVADAPLLCTGKDFALTDLMIV
ncbi:MAG: type II toxin-antitoxin system VapC family toxin [Acidobacteriota bacterium]